MKMKKQLCLLLIFLCLLVSISPVSAISTNESEKVELKEISEKEYIEALESLKPFIVYCEENETHEFSVPTQQLSRDLGIRTEKVNAIQKTMKAYSKVSEIEYNIALDLLRPYISRADDGTYDFTMRVIQLREELKLDLNPILAIQHKIWENNQLIRKGYLKEIKIDKEVTIFVHSDGRVELLYTVDPEQLDKEQREVILKLMGYDEELSLPALEIDIIRKGGMKISDNPDYKSSTMSLPSYIEHTAWVHYSGTLYNDYIHTHYTRARRYFHQANA